MQPLNAYIPACAYTSDELREMIVILEQMRAELIPYVVRLHENPGFYTQIGTQLIQFRRELVNRNESEVHYEHEPH